LEAERYFFLFAEKEAEGFLLMKYVLRHGCKKEKKLRGLLTNRIRGCEKEKKLRGLLTNRIRARAFLINSLSLSSGNRNAH